MSSTLKVSIIIPNFNGEDLLKDNLPKVMESFRNKANNIIEIIVVDDASKDKSIEILEHEFSGITLIKHKVNRGFSAAVNMGVRMAKGDLVCLLNTDVSPTSNFLESTLSLFSNKKVFAVSLHEKGYGPSIGEFSKGMVLHSPGMESTKVQSTFWVNGGSGVFRRSIWLELGGMDEKIYAPFYWEDVDLSYKALKAGYGILWNPDSLVYHQHESTIGRINLKKRTRIQERNHLLFIWKNLSSSRLINKHIIYLIKKVLIHPGYVRIVLMATFKLKLVLKARSKLKRIEKISDEAIFESFK